MRVPDSATSSAAQHLALQSSSDMLYRHALRSFVLGSLLAAGIRYDDEALFVGCILHDLGLTSTYRDPVRPFEEVSADAATELTERHGWALRRREVVHRAIVAHMALEVSDSETAEAQVLAAGVSADVTGRRLDELDPDVLRRVFTALPRTDFATTFPQLLDDEASTKPGGSADVLLRHGLLERIATAQHHRFAAFE